MNVTIKEQTRKFYTSFELDRREKYKNGVPRAVTTCKILLMTETSGPTLVGTGVTILGKKDKFDSLVGCKIALQRALDDAKLGKYANTLFWQEFQLRHRRLDYAGGKVVFADTQCPHRVKAKGSGNDWCTKHSFDCTPSAPCDLLKTVADPRAAMPHGYGGLYSHRLRKQYAMCNPTGRGPDSIFRTYTGKTWPIWHRVAGETIVPADKPGTKQQAEDRRGDTKSHQINNVSHADVLKAMVGGTDIIHDTIIKDMEKKRQWLDDIWPNAEIKARLQEIAAGADYAELEKRLLSEAGVTKVFGDEFVVDTDKYVEKFSKGQVLRHKGEPVRVIDVNGPLVTIQPLVGENYPVLDWELELLVRPQPGRIVQAWRAVKRWWNETDKTLAPKLTVSADADYVDYLEGGRRTIKHTASETLYDLLKGHCCPDCPGAPTLFVPPMHPGPRSSSTTRCKYCGTEYWYSNERRTAKKLSK